jgi:hypothetical protein
VPVPALASCAEVPAIVPFAPDGDYLLGTGDTILTVYCHDMAGTPRGYVTLRQVGPDENFSQDTAGLASRGTNVRTSYRTVRIDPATLRVDIGDTTFASSTGSLVHANSGTVVTTMPYGEVADLAAGAYCGWISAAPEGPPYDTTPGGLRLDLACAAPSGGLLTALLAARQFCHAYRRDLAGTPPEEPRIGSAP